MLNRISKSLRRKKARIEIKSSSHSFTYIPIPKNACSTIKNFIYELDNQTPYLAKNDVGNIHQFYETKDYIKSIKKINNDKTIVVIREPILRFLSCYGNRVVELNDLSSTEKELKALGLPINPDLNTFIEHLETYNRVNPSVRHHTYTQKSFIGNNLEGITDIYQVEKFKEINEFLVSMSSSIEIRKEKADGVKFSLSNLSAKSIKKLIDFYAEDYGLLRDFYSSEAIVKRYNDEKG